MVVVTKYFISRKEGWPFSAIPFLLLKPLTTCHLLPKGHLATMREAAEKGSRKHQVTVPP